MTSPIFRRAAACVLALTFAGAVRAQLTAPVAPPKPPTKIELPSQSLGIFNRFGLHSLYLEFWRRPVLVVSWRADEPACEQLVPAMLALAEREGGDLALLFVERSRLQSADMLRFVAHRKWLCGSALWTCDVPPGTELQGTPSFVLTSPAHEVALAGDPVADRELLTKTADVVVEQRRSGTADMPAELRDGLRALHAGQLAAAVKLVAALEPAQRAVVEDDIGNRLAVANELLAGGYALEAQARFGALAKALEGLGKEHRLLVQAQAGVQVFECGDFNQDLKAGPTLAKLQDQLCTRGPSASLAQLLRGLAKANADTAVAKRALALAEIAEP